MIDAPAGVPSPRPRWRRILVRFVVFLAVMTCIGFGLRAASSDLGEGATPAGFSRGVLHGALMPCNLPYLLAGFDMKIYASNNTGRTYHLGYTLGVNLCGALFFGLLFWRLGRWRRGGQETGGFRRDTPGQGR